MMREMEEKMMNNVAFLLEESGCRVDEVKVRHLLPSKDNEIRNEHELCIIVRYGKPERSVNR